jgi:fatty-acyl-CoA synthase
MELHYSSIFEAHADRIGERMAIRQGAVSRSWAEFDARAACFAGAMSASGLAQGSRIGQLLYNSPELLETYHGSLKLRAVPFNINFRYTADEIIHILTNAGAEALVFHSSLSTVVAEVIDRFPALKAAVGVNDGGVMPDRAIDMEDLLAEHAPMERIARSGDDPVMIYTGGTTGLPKGVMTPVRLHIGQVLQTTPPFLGEPPIAEPADLAPLAAQLHRGGRSMIGLPLPPMVHGAALNIVGLPVLLMGGTVVLASGRHFDAAETWDLVERERINSAVIVGDAFARPLLVELETGPPRDISSLQSLSSAGAFFSAEVKAGLLAHMCPGGMIIDFVSATEAAMGVSIATRDQPIETGRFRPHPGVIIVDDHDRPIAPGTGEAGRIAVPSSTGGYFGDAASTGKVFRLIGGCRYAIPGDLAIADADGTMRLLGRGSTCINSGGLKIFPEEVEEALKTHPAVADALVLGVPDPRFGERVAALLSLRDGAAADPEDILDAMRRHLASFKLPRLLKIVGTVPRTNVGKPDYRAARSLLGDGASPSAL